MARQTLESRVESVEQRVTALERLPARMDRLESQILQFRAEVRDEFSSIRDEIRDGNAMIVTTLMEQIEESRRHTRVLFEEAVARISTTQESRPDRKE